MVKVYSKPDCKQCDMTYKVLASEGVDYEVINVTVSDAGFEKVRELGYLQVPVVVTDTDHWSGFRPDKIKEIAA